MTGCTVRRYEPLETSPETIEQELRQVCSLRTPTDRLKENYSIKYEECMQLASTVMPGNLNNDNYFCLIGSFFHHIITSVPSEYFTVTPNAICWSLMNFAGKKKKKKKKKNFI